MYEWTYELSALVAGIAIGIIATVMWNRKGKKITEAIQAELNEKIDRADYEIAKMKLAAEAYKAKYDDLKQQILDKAKEAIEK